jgi:hypothetical protein
MLYKITNCKIIFFRIYLKTSFELKLTISFCSLGKEENKHRSYAPDAKGEAKFKTKTINIIDELEAT